MIAILRVALGVLLGGIRLLPTADLVDLVDVSSRELERRPPTAGAAAVWGRWPDQWQ